MRGHMQLFAWNGGGHQALDEDRGARFTKQKKDMPLKTGMDPIMCVGICNYLRGMGEGIRP